MISIDELRRHFPILAATTYLNSCSLGALSHEAEAELSRFLSRWHARGAAAWYEEWMEKLAELRTRVARLHNAPEGSIALLPSTSAALSVIATALDDGRGPLSDPTRSRVVVGDLDFPTLPYQWMVKPQVEVVRATSHDRLSVPPDAFAACADNRTRFVATSHVCYSTGAIQDIERIAAVAHDVGALSLIDGYQAPGQIPVDVTSAGVDIYTSGPLKWLCGGPGLAYLYVRPELLNKLSPTITSWFAAEHQFDFDAETFSFRRDARRFELGTPSLPSVHLALGAHRLLEDFGFARIHERVGELTNRLVSALEDRGWTLRIAAPDQRSGIVMIRHDSADACVAQLEADGFVIDHRPGHLRVSPHVYNTETEIDRFVEALGSPA